MLRAAARARTGMPLEVRKALADRVALAATTSSRLLDHRRLLDHAHTDPAGPSFNARLLAQPREEMS
jgi:hypothetical protein